MNTVIAMLFIIHIVYCSKNDSSAYLTYEQIRVLNHPFDLNQKVRIIALAGKIFLLYYYYYFISFCFLIHLSCISSAFINHLYIYRGREIFFFLWF